MAETAASSKVLPSGAEAVILTVPDLGGTTVTFLLCHRDPTRVTATATPRAPPAPTRELAATSVPQLPMSGTTLTSGLTPSLEIGRMSSPAQTMARRRSTVALRTGTGPIPGFRVGGGRAR